MASRIVSLCSAIILVLLSGSSLRAAPAGNQPLVSTAQDQQSLALTIYNVNLGLVKDRRSIDLPKGGSELRFGDVASRIIPESVQIASLSDPSGLLVLEQNYEYDLLGPRKLLDKYVGREVKLYTKNPYSEREEEVTATLLANNDGPVFKIGDEITFGHPGRIIFPGVPPDLMSKPTLVWLLESGLGRTQQIEATYLTNGISWRADYVMTLNDRDSAADLAGWVTIDNKSGATYRDATLKLVAGDVHRVQEGYAYEDKVLRPAQALSKAAAPQFREESLFEYHVYTLDRRATVKDNQTKQIRLMQANSIPVAKELRYDGTAAYFTGRWAEPMTNQKVSVFIELQNTKRNNLGLPLPKGTVRVYKRDSDGSLQFVGEDSIDHTARDEKIRIKLGEAFDVTATRKQTDWKKIASDTYEAAFEISLRNHKNENISVKVIEPIPGDWAMLAASHRFVKTSAFNAEFNVSVPKDGETTLTYRVRMRY